MIITTALRAEMEKDIELCKNHNRADGSEFLYNELVAKYSFIDADFSKNLSSNGKVTMLGQSFDFRPELKAISNKLHMMLLLSSESEEQKENPLKLKVEEFFERGRNIIIEEFHPAEKGFGNPYVSGPKYNTWMNEINIFNERYLKTHPLYQSISSTYFHRNNKSSSCSDMLGYLEALLKDSEYWRESLTSSNQQKLKEITTMSNKVFIVHGHDNAAKESMARALEKAGFEAIILHEQADAGMTIIEKIEKYTDVAFAVVLYTECDLGRAKEDNESKNRYRARQNVVFEHGYLIGKLSRKNVCAFVKGDIETPGDISGVVYVPMDDNGAWKMQLCKNMNAAGLNVDVSKMI